MSIPEPDPQPKGIVVSEHLINFLCLECSDEDFPDALQDYQRALVQLIRDRDEFGRKKYGQPLMSEDGRSGVEDAKQELGDLLQYTYKALYAAEEDTKELEMLILTAYVALKKMYKVFRTK